MQITLKLRYQYRSISMCGAERFEGRVNGGFDWFRVHASSYCILFAYIRHWCGGECVENRLIIEKWNFLRSQYCKMSYTYSAFPLRNEYAKTLRSARVVSANKFTLDLVGNKAKCPTGKVRKVQNKMINSMIWFKTNESCRFHFPFYARCLLYGKCEEVFL